MWVVAPQRKWHADFDIYVFKSYLRFAHVLYNAARLGVTDVFLLLRYDPA